MKRTITLLAGLLLLAGFVQAQIRVSSANIDTWIKANLGGQGVVVGNIRHHGNPISQGTFTSPGNLLQVQKGIVLSSGNVFNIPGFNSSYNLSAALGNLTEPETDADLAKLVNGGLYDISYVEFDFVPMGNSVQFNYQFGSDEYPEYVGSAFNDIFAFFISDENGARNMALVPGKTIPVSINNVNFKSDSEYYIDNNPFSQVTIKRQAPPAEKVQRSFFGSIWQGIKNFFGSGEDEEKDRVEILPDQNLVKKMNPNLYRSLQYDGITKKLVAQAYVQPYKKYHLKMIIADVSDNIYDSGVFIEDRSLTAKKDPSQPGFVDYPDLAGKFDPQLILQGKTIQEILPGQLTPAPTAPATPAPATAPATPATAPATPAPATAPATSSPATATSTPATTAPATATPATAPSNTPLTIYFDFDRSDIVPVEMEKIRKALAAYQGQAGRYQIYIAGHTDNKGSLDYNYALSRRRNEAVIQAIRQLEPGISLADIQEKAFNQPAADNATDEGRRLNRRVELIFKKK